MNRLDDIHQQVEAYYSDKARRFGDSPKGVDWKDRDSQFLRFGVLADVLKTNSDFTVLDVGCGTGELLTFLNRTGRSGYSYRGIDLSEEMIRRAGEKRWDGCAPEFMRCSLEEVDGEYDYVVSSGIFNVKGDEAGDVWLEYIKDQLRKQFQRTRVGLAANFLTSYVDWTVPHLYYCDPGELLRFAKTELSRFVSIRHDYPLYEHTLFVYRTPITEKN